MKSDSNIVRIEKLVPGGDGLGHLDGRAVFVPLTTPGDLVTLDEVHRRRGVLFAEVDEIIESAPGRRIPPCPWFGICGGCQWMQMEYGSQIRWKEEILRQALRGIAHLGDKPSIIIHAAPAEFKYRFRARLQIEGKAVGFYRRSSHSVVAWERCMLLPEAINATVESLRTLFEDRNRLPNMSSCEISLSPLDGSVTLQWVFSKGKHVGGATRTFMESVENLISERNLELAGQSARTLNGVMIASRGSGLSLEVGGIRMSASPGTFLQVNPLVNDILVERTLVHLISGGSTTLLDLYCGNGNFSLPAAARGLTTTGVEFSPGAVQDARAASGPRSRFIKMDTARFLKQDREIHDAVIVDPPRTGLPREVTRLMAAKRFPLLIYVSCDPSTLARDLARLTQDGYVISDMELLDMFPQTSHFEALVVMKGLN